MRRSSLADSWWPAVRSGDLVRFLSDDEHGRLLAAMEPCSLSAGETALGKGEPSDSLLLVEEGELEVIEESMGESVSLASVGPGGVVGEVGFVDGKPRTHHVRARTACRLRSLSRPRLLELVKDDPALFAKLVVGLAELIAARFRLVVRELEPIRAFAASLKDPLAFDERLAHAPAAPADADFDEIDEPLPEAALELVRELARKAQGDLTGL
jgi:CRP-like cAMP-binding protein